MYKTYMTCERPPTLNVFCVVVVVVVVVVVLVVVVVVEYTFMAHNMKPNRTNTGFSCGAFQKPIPTTAGLIAAGASNGAERPKSEPPPASG
jgi:hypothetical protein